MKNIIIFLNTTGFHKIPNFDHFRSSHYCESKIKKVVFYLKGSWLYSCPLLTLFDHIIAVAVGVVGHVPEEGVVGMGVFGAQAVCICGRVCASSAREFPWQQNKHSNS